MDRKKWEFPDQDTCPGGQPEYVLDLDTAGIQCEMEDQWMIDGLWWPVKERKEAYVPGHNDE